VVRLWGLPARSRGARARARARGRGRGPSSSSSSSSLLLLLIAPHPPSLRAPSAQQPPQPAAASSGLLSGQTPLPRSNSSHSALSHHPPPPAAAGGRRGRGWLGPTRPCWQLLAAAELVGTQRQPLTPSTVLVAHVRITQYVVRSTQTGAQTGVNGIVVGVGAHFIVHCSFAIRPDQTHVPAPNIYLHVASQSPFDMVPRPDG
jgi:hypothetical protein